MKTIKIGLFVITLAMGTMAISSCSQIAESTTEQDTAEQTRSIYGGRRGDDTTRLEPVEHHHGGHHGETGIHDSKD